MVAVIFCTETSRHLNYSVSNQITVYQTNTEHRAESCYNESNAQNKFTLKFLHQIYIEVVMLLTLCTNLQVFAHFALQSSPMQLYFRYLSCKHFPEITHQYILFAPFFFT